MNMKIMQGDSYPILMELTQNGVALTPNVVDDIEVNIGDAITKRYSAGEVMFDEASQKWYVRPSQAETLALMADESYRVTVRVKYKNTPADVRGMVIGTIDVDSAENAEVI